MLSNARFELIQFIHDMTLFSFFFIVEDISVVRWAFGIVKKNDTAILNTFHRN